MFIQFLIEDQSTEILIRQIMPRVSWRHLTGDQVQFDCKSFKGIGQIPKKGSITERKTGHLLNDLPAYLRAFDKMLSSMPDSWIVVVLDNDMNDPKTFLQSLESLAQIRTHHAFCLAIKEMEAWLLGDPDAIKSAYPDAKLNLLRQYRQDALCDTWQLLADIVHKGGFKALKQGPYSNIGKAKCDWARRIGSFLSFTRNRSPSFQHLMQVFKLAEEASAGF